MKVKYKATNLEEMVSERRTNKPLPMHKETNKQTNKVVEIEETRETKGNNILNRM